MEGTQGQLGTGFTNRLARDNTDRFADVNQRITRQIHTIALCTQAVAAACQHTADINAGQTRFIDFLSQCF